MGADKPNKSQALPVTFEDAGHVVGSRRVHTDQLDVFISRDNRDEQYQIVLNWNGQDKMRNFDLSRRNLSELILMEQICAMLICLCRSVRFIDESRRSCPVQRWPEHA